MSRDLAASGEVRTRTEVPRELRRCSLCGAFVMHGIVDPPRRARLIYRASEDLAGNVWVPTAHLACPDPEPDTASFWSDDVRREAYKRRRRDIAKV